MKPQGVGRSTKPSPEPHDAPCEFVMPGTARAAASARRARSMRSAGGSAATEGSWSPRSISSAGGVSVGQPGRGVLAGDPRHRDRLADERVESGLGEVRRVGGRGAAAHEHAKAQGLAPRVLQGLDLALADGDGELGPFADDQVGPVGPGAAGDLEQVVSELAIVH